MNCSFGSQTRLTTSDDSYIYILIFGLGIFKLEYQTEMAGKSFNSKLVAR